MQQGTLRAPSYGLENEGPQDLSGELPLCVDLDGTLLKTDGLDECFVRTLRADPAKLCLLPVHLMRGREYVKAALARLATIDHSVLPLNPEFASFLEDQHRRGRKLFLVSAADPLYAVPVANRLGIFAGVITSSPGRNLKGKTKAQVLVEQFGEGQFDYAGNSSADLPIWKVCRHAIAVGCSSGVASTFEKSGRRFIYQFDAPKSDWKAVAKALRVHQWAKNALLAVPLVTAHYVTDLHAVLLCAVAIVSFSLAASSLYIFNDLLDLDADRTHPTKKNRPFASGRLSIRFGLALSLTSFVTAFAIAFLISTSFVKILAVYSAGSFLYSTVFKSMLLVDVLFLAGLYSLRIIAGGIAVGVPLSQWLIAFTSFFFLSLALAKRVIELHLFRDSESVKLKNRGYVKGDAAILSAMGVAAGYLSILVFALWIDSPTVTLLYKEPRALWLIIPLLTLWISRVWVLAHRGEIHDDPVVFALTDRQSYATVLAAAGLVLLAVTM